MRMSKKSRVLAAADPHVNRVWKLATVMTMLSTLLLPGIGTLAAESLPVQCEPKVTGGPMWVTADCVDSLYSHPVIDSEIDLTTSVPIHKVSGHFEGTNKKFNFYFPPKSQWKGRFYHYVYPLISENAEDNAISFGADSGAYTVQTNGGSGYRVDAAAAKFSKTVAARYYGSSSRVYGYIWGGSGGSYMTISAIENTSGVWDGAVPFIPGTPTSIPNNFFVRAFARFVLADKAPQIADAVSPGGSGDPYVGLNEDEQAVLQEVTQLGVPLRGWMDNSYLLGLNDPQGLLGFAGTVRALDPTYANDFWSKPGYLGTEQSSLGDMFRAAKIDQMVGISQVTRNGENVPTSLMIDNAPASPKFPVLDFTLYAADGTTKIGTLSGSLNAATKVFTIASGNQENVLNAINNNAKLQIDNQWPLALLTYHRHQVPSQPGFSAWDQFRAPDGTPLYPQRPMEIGQLIAQSVTGGGTYTGSVNGKVIVVTNLLDVDAYPWDGDWYSQRVKANLGPSYDDNFRIWYNDYADHVAPHNAFLVDYLGILEQALRDVSTWAEQGVAPAHSTRYEMVGNQVSIPANAAVRRGIQPVVDLTVKGTDRIDISSGQTVTFKAKIQVPTGAGKVVNTAWDFLGNGNFTTTTFGTPKQTVEVSMTYQYTKPGVYFPALRATSQREGDANTPFAKIQNLGRVRVVVH